MTLKILKSALREHNSMYLELTVPYSWSYGRKWAATAVVSSFTFISPVSSSMVAPASDQVAATFGINNNVIIALTTSIFVLAYGKRILWTLDNA